MQLFKREAKAKTPVPAALKPDNPVNYYSVLDWLVGLGPDDFKKMVDVSNVYREANAQTAAVLGIDDAPSTFLFPEEPTEEEVDAALDTMLAADNMDFLEETDNPALPDDHAPSKLKVKVEDK